MIVTLSGRNSFALLAKLKQLTAEFIAENDVLGLERIDGQEAELDRIRESLYSLPFLSTHKMVVLREPGTNKQFAEDIEQISAHIPKTTSVIFVEPNLDKRLGYYTFLKKNTDFLEFNELDANDLSRWLVDAAKQKAGSLNPANARYLVERVGANQQLLANELEKLLLYDFDVTRANIDLLTENSPQSTIFQLLESAFAGNTKNALKLYDEQRALKIEPQQIIAMLSWQLHILALIKTAGDRSAEQIASEAKLNPFVVRKSQGISKSISIKQLKGLIGDLLEIDIKSKSVAIDVDDALRLYLIKLST